MFTSLRGRLLFSHLLVGGAVLVLLSVSFLLILANNPAADRFVYSRLETISRVATATFRLRSVDRLPAGFERRLALQGRAIDADLAIFDTEGRIRFGRPEERALPPYDLVAETAASEGGRGTYQDGDGRRWLLVATPLAGGGTLAVVAPSPTVRTLTVLLREALDPLWQAAAVALGVSLVVALLLARWIARPLMEMARAAQGLASGDYEQRVAPEGPTETKELALAFNEMARQVQASQQAQRDFVANVSHELKTPLTSIQGFAQAIEEGAVVGEEDRRRAAGVIHEEAERLRRLVEDLLILARFDAGQIQLAREGLALGQLLEKVAGRFQVIAAEKEVQLDLRIPELPTLIGDADRLSQVFINLLDNALTHTPAGGRVTVEADAAGGRASVKVVDSGPGLDPDQLPRLFERFYQGDNARASGVGLGLAIAQEIVQAHGGRIWAESEPGAGSRFVVELPVARPTDSTAIARRQ